MKLNSHDPSIKIDRAKGIKLRAKEGDLSQSQSKEKPHNAIEYALSVGRHLKAGHGSNDESVKNDEIDNADNATAKDLLDAPANIYMASKNRENKVNAQKIRVADHAPAKRLNARDVVKGSMRSISNGAISSLGSIDENVQDVADKGKALMNIPSDVRRAKHISRQTAQKAKRAASNGAKATKFTGKVAGKVSRSVSQSLGKALASLAAALGPVGAIVAGIFVVIVLTCVMVFTLYGGEAKHASYNGMDIVEVAESQLGNVGGQPYWSWYGFRGRVPWCACFVSWCANQCDYLENDIIPKFALVSDGSNWFKARNQWKGRDYEPNPGDIIFFTWGGTGNEDHVGIVEKCEDGKVHTIEGNTTDSCARRTYSVGEINILGYGIPEYPEQSTDKDDVKTENKAA